MKRPADFAHRPNGLNQLLCRNLELSSLDSIPLEVQERCILPLQRHVKYRLGRPTPNTTKTRGGKAFEFFAVHPCTTLHGEKASQPLLALSTLKSRTHSPTAETCFQVLACTPHWCFSPFLAHSAFHVSPLTYPTASPPFRLASVPTRRQPLRDTAPFSTRIAFQHRPHTSSASRNDQSALLVSLAAVDLVIDAAAS